jgi:PTS system fructose-specific IIC component
MKILAITSCPTGIAHTYMAAEQLEKTAAQLGHTIKVETQGSMGIENELTAADVASADYVIFAADIMVENRERFDGKKILEISVSQAIKNPMQVFDKLV